MRKIVLSLAAAGAALVAASPAAAQYYPQPQPTPYGYNNGYGYNGYNQGNWGMVRSLRVRLENIERQINRLDRRDRIGGRSADRLREEANNLERRLRDRARGGLDAREAGELTYRIQRLEQRVQVAMSGRYGGYGNNGYGPDNSGLTIVGYLYRYAFENGDLGTASAVGWVLTLLIFIVSLAQIRIASRVGSER